MILVSRWVLDSLPFVLLAVIGLTNSPTELMSRKTLNQKPIFENLVLAVTTNFLIFSSALYISSFFLQTNTSTFFLLGLLGVINVAYFLYKIYRRLLSREFMYLFGAALLSPYFIQSVPIYFLSLNRSRGGAAVTGNNDIASYALVAEQFLNSGFQNSNLVVNSNLNRFAQESAYQSANFLVALSTFLSRRPAAEVMTMIMIVVIFLVIVSSMAAFSSIGNQKLGISTFLGSNIVLLFSMNNYLIANYFLAHLLAYLVLNLFLYTLFNMYNSRSLQTEDVLKLSLIFALGIYVYPPVLLPLLPILLIIFCFLWVVQKSKDFANLFKFFLVPVLGSVIALPYTLTALRLFYTQSKIQAGWPIPTLTPFGFFLSPLGIGFQSSIASLFVLWIACLGLLLFCVYKQTSITRNLSLATCITMIGVTLSYPIIFNVPTSQYQFWKLQSFTLFVISIIAIGSFLTWANGKAFTIVLLFGITSTTPIVEWAPALIQRSNITTAEMLDIQENNIIKSLNVLNIDVRPDFETMMIASILNDKKLNLVSTSYYAVSSDENSCTLFRLDNPTYARYLAINKTYGIAESRNAGSCTIPRTK